MRKRGETFEHFSIRHYLQQVNILYRNGHKYGRLPLKPKCHQIMYIQIWLQYVKINSKREIEIVEHFLHKMYIYFSLFIVSFIHMSVYVIIIAFI